jgi:hypothetical protein
MDEIIIDETNFHEYFRDTSTNRPEAGDVMVFYKSFAELQTGDLKSQMIDSLYEDKIGAQKAIQIFVKLGKASHQEALKVVKEMCADLHGGMTKDQVLEKPYKFYLQLSFYTKKEYVPVDNPHWELIPIKNFSGKDAG